MSLESQLALIELAIKYALVPQFSGGKGGDAKK